jgi:hypothetical protein
MFSFVQAIAITGNEIGCREFQVRRASEAGDRPSERIDASGRL